MMSLFGHCIFVQDAGAGYRSVSFANHDRKTRPSFSIELPAKAPAPIVMGRFLVRIHRPVKRNAARQPSDTSCRSSSEFPLASVKNRV